MFEAMVVGASWHAETFGGSNAVKDSKCFSSGVQKLLYRKRITISKGYGNHCLK